MSSNRAPLSVSNFRNPKPDNPDQGEHEIETAAPSQMRFFGSSQEFPAVGRAEPTAKAALPLLLRENFRPIHPSGDKLGENNRRAGVDNGGGGGTISGWMHPHDSGDITNNPYSNTLPPTHSRFDSRTRSNFSMGGEEFKRANEEQDLY
ncbi:hypothetical protein L2E82_48463 [Cichorium intybus]|uniref:Uncharacterized protein n=1 Tax=Cichorium intybus TaxID=13427 RepID=A0ACB8YZ98_CICIN|nr:hypothetical protein L2E82_48463 [Cichorium intybus]